VCSSDLPMPTEEGVPMVSMIQGFTMHRVKAMLGLTTPLGIALVFVLGCGDDGGLGRRYPVHGRVMYRSQPLELGQITFHPIVNAGTVRNATGTIQNGNYTLSTIGGDDGALPGTYRVAIVAKSVDRSKIQPIVEGGAAKHSDVIKATRQAKNLIPGRYMSPRTSPLTREVKAESNQFDFELED
jgi:hypothetical protein